MASTEINAHYRDKAEQYRRLAEEANAPELAERLRVVAEFYELLNPAPDEPEAY
jgi:hypothetical protein